jgi:hypothetical protein
MIRNDKEVELLLACSRPQMDKESRERICRLLQEEIDWDWVFKAARSHGVLPILYHNLKAVCPEAVSQNILLDFQRAYLLNARRNLIMTRELLRIIEDFRAHGIEAVPFKGPALAQMAYGDITLRSFSDLDIMVRKQNVPKAKELLISRGYHPMFKLTPIQERLLLQRGCEYNFVRNDPVIAVEIHWTFHPHAYSVPFDEEIWSCLETLTFEGTTVNSFSPEDLVLHLCAHGTRHQWTQIKLVSDLAGLTERHNIDWDRVMVSATEMGLKRILQISLLLAHDVMGAEFPVQMFSEIGSDVPARKLALLLSEKLFVEANRRDGCFENYLFWAKTRERLWDKAVYLLAIISEPTTLEFDMITLPEFLYPFYRIIRPVRLFYKHGLKRRI